MEQDLFIAPALTFEKVASEATLPEDPNTWPHEILQELFKQVPYIADFDPHVVMDRVDAERGYAFGHVDVVNKSEIQRGTDEASRAAAGIRQARIPLVVRNRKLQPLDVLVTEDSKMLPLTEQRLRQAVFRPQAFDVTSQTPGDMSMIGQLYPPFRQNYGFGGGGATMGVGMGKQGSVSHASILLGILPTIPQQDYQNFFDKLANENLQAAYLQNAEATAPALGTLAQYAPVDAAKTASTLYGDIPVDVLQIQHTDNGYLVKRANHNFWAPVQETWDRGEVARAFGDKVALTADMHGSVVFVKDASVDSDLPEADTPELIKDFGVYKVQDETGKHIIGYVFPNLFDIDGTALPICLFTNGTVTAVQGEIVGVNIGGGASLFEGRPHGYGAFYEVLSNGRAQCTVPMTIQASLTNVGETNHPDLVGETYDGRPVVVRRQPNLQRIVAGADGHMLIPAHMSWLPLGESKTVTLTSDPTTFAKTASALALPLPAELRMVTVRAGGPNAFSFEGLPVEKLAHEQRNFLPYEDAVFLLAGLGVTPAYATMKLAQACDGAWPVELLTGRSLVFPEQAIQQYEQPRQAFDKLARALSVDLVKEAAVIPDPVAVDTVLSLGFINGENLQSFVSYLPKIDEAQSKLCELLIAARLGLRELPTTALEKAIRAVEEVIEGLNVLAFGGS